MERELCPVCAKRVSNWQMANGKTLAANGNVYHKSCLDDKTVADLEAKGAKATLPVYKR